MFCSIQQREMNHQKGYLVMDLDGQGEWLEEVVEWLGVVVVVEMIVVLVVVLVLVVVVVVVVVFLVLVVLLVVVIMVCCHPCAYSMTFQQHR